MRDRGWRAIVNLSEFDNVGGTDSYLGDGEGEKHLNESETESIFFT